MFSFGHAVPDLNESALQAEELELQTQQLHQALSCVGLAWEWRVRAWLLMGKEAHGSDWTWNSLLMVFYTTLPLVNDMHKHGKPLTPLTCFVTGFCQPSSRPLGCKNCG